MSKAGQRMIAGAQEALAYARGEDTGARIYDGRMFGWQRSDVTGWTPVIVWDPQHGCTKNFEIIGRHLLQPHEYRLSLAELAAKFPAPANREE